MDSITSPKVKTSKEEKVRACSLAHNTLRVKGCAEAPKSKLARLIDKSITHTHS
jgi:hypothetical protein